ncbi:hypothetical protein HDU77_001438 [Chytriomyces hyalinus]|nr:hypothetical protein HDU77_001438 [Chytriomyces hyalinus]
MDPNSIQAVREAYTTIVNDQTTSPAVSKLNQLRQFLLSNGFLQDDPRFRDIYAMADSSPSNSETPPASPASSDSTPRASSSIKSRASFDIPLAENVVDRAFNGGLAIPDLPRFMAGVRNIFDKVASQVSGGKVASYIPQLASVDPDLFAVSFCSIDGQRFSFGDSNVEFSIQSCCKPISYSIALEEVGATKVHQHIGREPSGRSFNHMSLLDRKIPHNPMINAGAIMSSSLIQRGNPLYKRFSKVSKVWTQLFGGKRISFNNSIYLSEKETADRNFALAYMMKEAGAFPEGTDIKDTLEFYFQCCSLEADSDRMAIMAATYANGGVCPLTGETVFEASTVRNCVSLMASCGMYDYSGEWNFSVGLPAKSGVSGAIWVVVPDVGGFCCYSPCIDSIGNSRRAVEFFKALSDTYAFHMLEPARLRGLKNDPTLSPLPRAGVMKSSKRNNSNTSGNSGKSAGSGEDEEVSVSTQLARTLSLSNGNISQSPMSDGVGPSSPVRHALSVSSGLSTSSTSARSGTGVNSKLVPIGMERSSSKGKFRKSVVEWFNKKEEEELGGR